MSDSPGKWETVVSKKGRGPASKSDVKKAQQKFLDNASSSKVDVAKPIKEAETIYQSFDKRKGENKEVSGGTHEKEAGDHDKYPSFYATEFAEGDKDNKSATKQVKPIQLKKKQQKVFKPEFTEMEEKIKKLNFENLQSLIAEVSERFPEHPLIWLKEAASWLQIQLGGVAEKDIGLLHQPQGFPANLLPKSISECLLKLLKKSPLQSIEMLFLYCTTMMLTALQHGKSTIGLRILIQLIVAVRPEVVQSKMEEVLNGKSKSHESYLALMWTFSQITHDLRVGIDVWWNVMFPVLKVRTHCTLAINYIEQLLLTYSNLAFDDSYLLDEQFLGIMDAIYGCKSPLVHSPTLKTRLEDLYPIFVRLYFTDKPDCDVIQNAFRTLLKYLKVGDESIENEVLKLLVFCLSRNPTCFKVWRDTLGSRLRETSLFLKYIYNNHDDVRKQLIAGRKYKSKDIIRLTAGEFIVLLGDLNRKGCGSKPGFADCVRICEKFTREDNGKKSSGMSIFKILKYFFFILFGLVAIDLYKNKGYQGSRTSHIVKKYQIDEGAEFVFSYAEKAADVTGKWAKDNVPFYYGKAHYYLAPAMECGWNYTVQVSTFVYDHSKPVREYLNEKLPPILEKIDEVLPKYIAMVTECIQKICNTVVPFVREHSNCVIHTFSENIPKLVSHVSDVTNRTSNWIYELQPSFFDSCSLYATDAWNKIAECTNDACNTIVKYTPIVWAKVIEIALMVFNSTKEHMIAGQSWIQLNLLRSFESRGAASSK